MGTVVIHRLTGTKKAHEACRLVEALFDSGKRVIAWVDDAGRAATFNDYLWTFAQHAFVPHSLWDGAGPADDPVVVATGELPAQTDVSVLVVVDRLGDPALATSFVEIHDFVTQAPEDANKAESWRDAGFQVVEVQGLALPGK